MSDSTFFKSSSPVASSTEAIRALSAISGLQLVDAYRGLLSIGSESAEVLLEPNDFVRFKTPVESCESPFSKLTINACLPGNVRFARSRGDELLADTHVNGKLHLPATFRQVRDGFLAALSPSAQLEAAVFNTTTERVTKQHMDGALAELEWGSEAIVDHADGWELRVCLAGESFPVVAELVNDNTALVLRQTILPVIPPLHSARRAACLDQALRFNRQLRLVRLACAGEGLVCESRLHAGQLQPFWLALTARALAFSLRRVRPPLRVLADQELVAANYAAMFCRSKEAGSIGNVAG